MKLEVVQSSSWNKYSIIILIVFCIWLFYRIKKFGDSIGSLFNRPLNVVKSFLSGGSDKVVDKVYLPLKVDYTSVVETEEGLYFAVRFHEGYGAHWYNFFQDYVKIEEVYNYLCKQPLLCLEVSKSYLRMYGVTFLSHVYGLNYEWRAKFLVVLEAAGMVA